MKVKHLQVAEKAVRKTQRNLNKMTKTGSQEEIEEAKMKLNEAKLEMQDVSSWMHPKETMEKLISVLSRQIEDKDGDEITQITQKLINDTQESLQMIESGQKEAMYFKFIAPFKENSFSHSS